MKMGSPLRLMPSDRNLVFLNSTKLDWKMALELMCYYEFSIPT